MTSRKLTVLLAAALSAVLVMPLAACSKSEPPTGTVRLETEEAVVNAAMLTHGYSWDNSAVDPVPPTELTDDDVPDVEISETTEVSASFSQPATEVEVVRYAEDGTLEGVECALEDGAATSISVAGCEKDVRTSTVPSTSMSGTSSSASSVGATGSLATPSQV